MGFREAIEKIVRREARPVEKFGHQPRLYALTREIGAGLDYDDDIVFAAAWLHDIGVFQGHRPEDPADLAAWDLIAYAVQHVPGLLRKAGFPEEKTAAVIEAIRTHQPHHEPTTIEGVILRDADILEQLGAIGILRTVCKVGRDTRFTTFTDAAAVLQGNLNALPQLILLAETRVLAEPRIVMLQQFLAGVAESAIPALF